MTKESQYNKTPRQERFCWGYPEQPKTSVIPPPPGLRPGTGPSSKAHCSLLWCDRKGDSLALNGRHARPDADRIAVGAACKLDGNGAQARVRHRATMVFEVVFTFRTFHAPDIIRALSGLSHFVGKIARNPQGDRGFEATALASPKNPSPFYSNGKAIMKRSHSSPADPRAGSSSKEPNVIASRALKENAPLLIRAGCRQLVHRAQSSTFFG